MQHVRPSLGSRWPLLTMLAACIAGGVCASSQPARADAVAVSDAVNAPTILTLQISSQRLVAEFEIGPDDAPAFQHLLPPEIRLEAGGLPVRRDPERGTDWTLAHFLKTEAGFLEPSSQRFEIRTRRLRDDLTGDVIAAGGPDDEIVIVLLAEYRLETPRAFTELTLHPPATADNRAQATIGMLVRHDTISVNDFRYLARAETLAIDWDDPWYTEFDNPNLVRHHAAPLSVFLNVDYFEVRKELLVRARDLQRFSDVGVPATDTIPVAAQEQIKQRAAEFLLSRCPVTIDGKTVPPRLDRVHFVRRNLRNTEAIEPPEELNRDEATLGLIIVYPIEGLPEQVELKWDLFSERIPAIAAFTEDQAGVFPYELFEDDPVLTWINHLQTPRLPRIVELPRPQPATLTVYLVTAAGVLGVLLGLLIRRWPRLRPAWFNVCVIALGAAIVGHRFPQVSCELPRPGQQRVAPTPEERVQILAGLIHNSYQAFKRRDEQLVYDRLELSISGDLLRQVYLDIRRSIEAEQQQGTRVNVEQVQMLSVSGHHTEPATRFEYTCQWSVLASVSHWGHAHQRENRYEARIAIADIDGRWKMAELELLDARRTDAAAGAGPQDSSPEQTP